MASRRAALFSARVAKAARMAAPRGTKPAEMSASDSVSVSIDIDVDGDAAVVGASPRVKVRIGPAAAPPEAEEQQRGEKAHQRGKAHQLERSAPATDAGPKHRTRCVSFVPAAVGKENQTLTKRGDKREAEAGASWQRVAAAVAAATAEAAVVAAAAESIRRSGVFKGAAPPRLGLVAGGMVGEVTGQREQAAEAWTLVDHPENGEVAA